ncbi:unnamed protein product [Rhodiola kirilowii]
MAPPATNEIELVEFNKVDWSTANVKKLSQLVLSNLVITLERKIKYIMTKGFTKEDATTVIMRNPKVWDDIINCQVKDIVRFSFFEDVQQLGRYIVTNLVINLRAIRPSLSIGDAVWYMLLCELNTLQACALDGEVAASNNRGNVGQNSSAPTENKPDTEIKTSESDNPDPSVHNALWKPLQPSEIEVPSVSGFPLPTVNNTASISVDETEHSLSQPKKIGSHIVVQGNNVDESLQKESFEQCSGSEAKNLAIMKLMVREHELESQLKEWSKWTDRKLGQVVRQSKKLKAEREWLRQKEGAEKLLREEQAKKEKEIIKQKLSEMENALQKATKELERTDVASRKSEVENAALRQQMEIARCQSAESAANFQEALGKEKMRPMEIQSMENQIKSFQEELLNEKCKSAQIQQELGCAKDVLGQVEARLEQETKSTKDLNVQASSIREEMEQAEAVAISRDQGTILKAENDLQKYKDNIQKVEREISDLRQNIFSSEVAALERIIDQSTSTSQTTGADKVEQISNPPKKNSTGAASLMRNWECVMCLSQQVQVVFVPCAHQVICTKCNELHEMLECPACRTPIEDRIVVRR